MFLVNHVILAPLAFWLVFRLLQTAEGTERSYQVVRLIALGCVATFGYLSLVLGRRGNARLLLFFAATCVAGEMLMRMLGSYGIGAKSDVPWREPKPYVMFAGPTGGRTPAILPQMGSGKVQLSAEGFRIDREIVVPKSKDEVRIFVVGGSTVVGGPSAFTIPAVIESHLTANGLPQARVYNFGVVSFVSGQELALLVHRLIDLKPDLVIAYDGGNDLNQPWLYDPRPGYPFNYVAEEEAISVLESAGGAAKTLAGLSNDSALLQALLGTSDWLDRIKTKVIDLRRAVNFGSAQWKEAVVNAYARNLTEMCHVARANDASFAGYFQPMLPFSPRLDDRQVAIVGGHDRVSSLREQRSLTLQTVGAQFPPSVENGCRFGDLSGILEDRPAAFADALHVDEEANQLIGQRIAKELLAWPNFRSASMTRADVRTSTDAQSDAHGGSGATGASLKASR